MDAGRQFILVTIFLVNSVTAGGGGGYLFITSHYSRYKIGRGSSEGRRRKRTLLAASDDDIYSILVTIPDDNVGRKDGAQVARSRRGRRAIIYSILV